MSVEIQLVDHYESDGLLAAIERGLAALGKSRADVTVDDLGPVDEFHMGGRAATIRLIEQLGFGPADHVLDIGSGIGGTARLLASTTGCRVTGLDLVPGYVDIARELSQWTALEAQTSFEVGSAVDMPLAESSYDGATLLHVGMNIDDKAALFAEVRRVLRPGATLGVYDIMRAGAGEVTYPVPWASDASTSFLGDRQTYEDALAAAGFDVVAVDDRSATAIETFAAMRARAADQGGPPPVGLHLIMAGPTPAKLANMVAALGAGMIAPTEIVCTAR